MKKDKKSKGKDSTDKKLEKAIKKIMEVLDDLTYPQAIYLLELIKIDMVLNENLIVLSGHSGIANKNDSITNQPIFDLVQGKKKRG